MARAKVSADPAELEKLEWPYDWPPPWRNERLVGHDTAEQHDAGGAADRQAAPRLAADGTARHRQGDARLALRPLPAGGAGRAACSARRTASRWRARRRAGRWSMRARIPTCSICGARCNPDTGRMRSEIVVDDVRGLGEFMHMTPAMGDWRVAIVDAADEMNRNAANALLKILEEPPPNAVLLIVAHAPGRLLPTIRSRCRRLALQPLADETVIALLGDYAPDTRRRDGRRSRGSPKAASAARSSSRAPAASRSIARWSRCCRPCPISTCRACTASPSASRGAARRPTPTGGRSITCSTAG